MYLLLLGLLPSELLTRDRQLSPVVKNIAGRGTRNTHELRFDRPWKRRSTVLYEDVVGTESVNIFGIEEKAVHVEDAGAYGGEAIHLVVSAVRPSPYDHPSRDTAESRVQRTITDHMRHCKGFRT